MNTHNAPFIWEAPRPIGVLADHNEWSNEDYRQLIDEKMAHILPYASKLVTGELIVQMPFKGSHIHQPHRYIREMCKEAEVFTVSVLPKLDLYGTKAFYKRTKAILAESACVVLFGNPSESPMIDLAKSLCEESLTPFSLYHL